MDNPCLANWSPAPPPPVPPPEEQRAFGAALRDAALRRWPGYSWDEAMDVLSIAAMYARPYLEALMDGPWPDSGLDGAVRRDLEKVLRCRLPAVTGAADQEAAARSRAAKGLFTKKAKPEPRAEQETLPLLDGPEEEVKQPPPVRAVAVGDKARRRKGKWHKKARRAKATAAKTAASKTAKPPKAAKRTAAPKPKAGKTAKPKPAPKPAKPPAEAATPQAVAAIVRGLAAVDLTPAHAARLAGLDPKAVARMLAGKAKMPQATAEKLRGLIRAAQALREEAR